MNLIEIYSPFWRRVSINAPTMSNLQERVMRHLNYLNFACMLLSKCEVNLCFTWDGNFRRSKQENPVLNQSIYFKRLKEIKVFTKLLKILISLIVLKLKLINSWIFFELSRNKKFDEK